MADTGLQVPVKNLKAGHSATILYQKEHLPPVGSLQAQLAADIPFKQSGQLGLHGDLGSSDPAHPHVTENNEQSQMLIQGPNGKSEPIDFAASSNYTGTDVERKHDEWQSNRYANKNPSNGLLAPNSEDCCCCMTQGGLESAAKVASLRIPIACIPSK